VIARQDLTLVVLTNIFNKHELGDTQANVVVSITSPVSVTVSRTAVTAIIDPTTATQRLVLSR